MKLPISEKYFISDINDKDKPAYIEHLKEKQIYDQTLVIPFPYTEVEADAWLKFVGEITKTQGRSVTWAIRNSDGYLIGGIGFHDLAIGKSHRAELGYWIAKPYWGQGIMTEAVKLVTEFGFHEFGLIKVSAIIFPFNTASGRVLEKAGFQPEGYLRKHYQKDGKILDGKVYAKLHDDYPAL